MATEEDYSRRIQPLLQEGFGSQPLLASTGAGGFTVDELAGTLGEILEELERQHLGASENIKMLMAAETPEPWSGDGELAFLLYFLHNPPAELRQEIDALPELKIVWDAMVAVAAPASFTPDSFVALGSSLHSDITVKCNEWGDIYGTAKYEQLDTGWAWTLKNNLMNHVPKFFGKGYGIADFVNRDWSQPFSLKAGADNSVRIAILGDWGSGKYALNGLPGNDGPACAVMKTLESLDCPPDYLIHLGDTYYSGTGSNRSPRNEEQHNLVDMLKLYPAIAKPGCCFTLNSNHEMYGGAYGYYEEALAHELFKEQQGCSYFSLEFGDWILAGIDSAYYDPSALYMEGGLGASSDAQYKFLKQIKATGKKVILMSHHTGMSTDGSKKSKYLWKDVTDVISPDYWYWGHIHLGAVYSNKAFSGKMNARCIGHSSMPFAIPPGMEKCGANVDWYSNTPLDSGPTPQALYYSSQRAKNGFAVLTLSECGIREEIYEIGSKDPMWQKGP